MLQRVLVWIVRTYIRGPGRSWIYTSLALWMLRLVKRVTGPHAVVERLQVYPGQHLTIDHLEISHRAQIKDEKRKRRSSAPWRRRAD